MKKFLVFEGIDGSGKTTISKKLYEELRRRGIDCVLTREPFDENIRTCIDSFLKREADPLSVAFLFMADRIEHSRIIREWLDMGKVVISDRYEDSTYAYQGAELEGRIDAPVEFLKRVVHSHIIHPDRVYIIDIDPETGLKRSDKEGSFKTFEKIELLRKVRKNYLELARDERYMILDGRKSIDEILNICINDILGEEG